MDYQGLADPNNKGEPVAPRIDDGGPAYPCRHGMDAYGPLYTPGLSIRDHFAGLAMQAIVRDQAITNHGGVMATQNVCRWAYCYADEMLAARKEKP
jgi:hypothetical protein